MYIVNRFLVFLPFVLSLNYFLLSTFCI
uniref:Uncharacterized protein n=1 Tax=Rhizophora mucronata TaxID=61149 RepID=A0A2P2JZM4_RHIMU